MTWIKIDDRLPEHPKFFATSCRDAALNRYIIALCYCSRNLTDGVVPKDVLHEGRGSRKVCESMVSAGLLVDNGSSYVVKDYLEWNRNKREVLDIREKRRRAGQAGGQASWLKRAEANAERTPQAKANPDTDTEKDLKPIVRKAAQPAASDGTEAEAIAAVVAHLNERCGTRYRPTTEATKRHIRARLRDGFSLDDFRAVIDKKHRDWSGTEYEKYLRPETLFGSKFEGYLNEKPGKRERRLIDDF